MIISIINTIFDRFRDEKDSGILTLSHIYLLVGCSSPLWLCNNLHHSNQISLASGIMAIGIGDTIASVVGITYGNRRWPKSRKTYLGTFGFFLSHTLSLILFDYYFNGENHLNIFDFQLVIRILILSTISCLYETFTKHVDNLILPLIEYLLIRILF